MSGEQILVVDDDPIILELTSLLLRSPGRKVLVASNGPAALKLIDELQPALVLMDYMMPGMDGLQLLCEVKQRFPETYVIVFTGKGSEEVAVELMKAGASDYVRKPFHNQDLKDRVENVLRIRRIELHNQELLVERERLLEEIAAWNGELECRVHEKSRELEAAQSEIIQVEKLAALGHLAAGLAHEIRNPLNSILLFAQVMKNSLDEQTENVGYLDKIQSEVERIDGLLVELLAASRPSQRALEPVSLSELAREVIAFFLPQVEAHQVRLDLQIEEVRPISGNAVDLRQIFTNLCSNALHAMPHGGVLGIAVRNAEGSIAIDVSDTGCGIPRAQLNRVFDPFFSNRANGAGFGLSVVLRIVKTYQGKIAVESEEGQGTTFHLTFPAVHS